MPSTLWHRLTPSVALPLMAADSPKLTSSAKRQQHRRAPRLAAPQRVKQSMVAAAAAAARRPQQERVMYAAGHAAAYHAGKLLRSSMRDRRDPAGSTGHVLYSSALRVH